MNLFNELSGNLCPGNQNFTIVSLIPDCDDCECEMDFIETIGHIEGQNYGLLIEGDWIEDYDTYKCPFCGQEKKIWL